MARSRRSPSQLQSNPLNSLWPASRSGHMPSIMQMQERSSHARSSATGNPAAPEQPERTAQDSNTILAQRDRVLRDISVPNESRPSSLRVLALFSSPADQRSSAYPDDRDPKNRATDNKNGGGDRDNPRCSKSRNSHHRPSVDLNALFCHALPRRRHLAGDQLTTDFRAK